MFLSQCTLVILGTKEVMQILTQLDCHSRFVATLLYIVYLESERREGVNMSE